jgi:hypothetical protein
MVVVIVEALPVTTHATEVEPAGGEEGVGVVNGLSQITLVDADL